MIMCFSLKVPLSLNNELKQADLTCSLHDASAVLIVTVLENFKFTFSLIKISSVFLITFVLSYEWNVATFFYLFIGCNACVRCFVGWLTQTSL